MKLTLLSLIFLCGGCAHIGLTKGTFTQTETALVLQIDRHMEDLMHAPDLEEDQTLVLELHNYQVDERMLVPSAKAVARLEVKRFGPTSQGDLFSGWVMVRKVTGSNVVAKVNLVVTARTPSGNYVQTEKFDKQYNFFRAPVAE